MVNLDILYAHEGEYKFSNPFFRIWLLKKRDMLPIRAYAAGVRLPAPDISRSGIARGEKVGRREDAD